MENICNFAKSCLIDGKNSVSGYILVTTLLFLLILTFFIMGTIEISILNTKLARDYQDKMFSFQVAEINLVKKEKQLKGNSSILPAGVSEISSECGVVFYKVEAFGIYKGIKTTLYSTYALLQDASSCKIKPNITSGRKSWRELG